MKKILFALAALLSLAACNSNEPAPATDGKAIVESIMTRTSIREYTDQAISADTVETLLRAGMAAPSAVNKQPWHFIVVNKKEKLMELASTNPYAKMLEKAPLAIVVCGDMSKALEGDARAFWVQDCSAATAESASADQEVLKGSTAARAKFWNPAETISCRSSASESARRRSAAPRLTFFRFMPMNTRLFR